MTAWALINSPTFLHGSIAASKYERLSKHRLKMFMDMQDPNTEYKLPAIHVPPQNRTGGTGITFSISDGLQWKVREGEFFCIPANCPYFDHKKRGGG